MQKIYKTAAQLLLAVAVTSCGNDQPPTDTNLQLPENSLLCGATKVSPEGHISIIKCFDSHDGIKNLKFVATNPVTADLSQSCKLKLSGSGMPEQFNCGEAAREIVNVSPGAMVERAWDCNVGDDHISLEFFVGGKLEGVLPAIERSDDIWRAEDTRVAGDFTFDEVDKTLRFSLSRGHNNLTLRAGKDSKSLPERYKTKKVWRVGRISFTVMEATDQNDDTVMCRGRVI